MNPPKLALMPGRAWAIFGGNQKPGSGRHLLGLNKALKNENKYRNVDFCEALGTPRRLSGPVEQLSMPPKENELGVH
jgi:hypothetical protein